MLNLKCSECDVEFTINSKIKVGTYISCPLCQQLVMDEFDWEDRKNTIEDDF